MAKKSTKATKKSTKASKQAKVEETEAEEPEMQESPEEPQEEAEKLDVKDEEKTVDPDLAQTEEDQLNLQQLVEDIAEVTKNDIDGQAEDLDSEEKAEAEAEDEDEEEAEENEEDEVGEEDEENDEDEEKDDEAVEEGVEGDEGDEGDESSEDLGDLDESGELEDGEAEEGEGEPEGIEGISEAGIATQDGQKAKRDYGNLTEDQVKTNKIEAALFVAARPISVEEIMAKTDLKKKEIEIYIFKLAKEYQGRISAIEIVRVGDDKFSLQIKPEYTEDVKKFASGGLLKEAVMRTLTIIAAKQPISKSFLVKVRGAGAYDHVKELLQNELISEEKKGRSSELRTTERFADMFGLPRDINEMKRTLSRQLGIKDDKKEKEAEKEAE